MRVDGVTIMHTRWSFICLFITR